MSAILTPQGAVIATAMAISGTFILLTLRLQKNLPIAQFALHPTPLLQSCISSDGKKRLKKKKKKVHFAEDVIEPTGNSEEFRRQHKTNYLNTPGSNLNSTSKKQRMPANRAALYQGMLKNRVVH